MKFAEKRQNASFYIESPVKNFHGRVKGGHRTMPSKHATEFAASIERPKVSASI